MVWEVLGGKHLEGKLREMAAMIVASVNEMMKYSSTAYCTLHIGFTLLCHSQRKKEGKCYHSNSDTAIGTLDASESGLDNYR